MYNYKNFTPNGNQTLETLSKSSEILTNSNHFDWWIFPCYTNNSQYKELNWIYGDKKYVEFILSSNHKKQIKEYYENILTTVANELKPHNPIYYIRLAKVVQFLDYLLGVNQYEANDLYKMFEIKGRELIESINNNKISIDFPYDESYERLCTRFNIQKLNISPYKPLAQELSRGNDILHKPEIRFPIHDINEDPVGLKSTTEPKIINIEEEIKSGGKKTNYNTLPTLPVIDKNLFKSNLESQETNHKIYTPSKRNIGLQEGIYPDNYPDNVNKYTEEKKEILTASLKREMNANNLKTDTSYEEENNKMENNIFNVNLTIKEKEPLNLNQTKTKKIKSSLQEGIYPDNYPDNVNKYTEEKKEILTAYFRILNKIDASLEKSLPFLTENHQKIEDKVMKLIQMQKRLNIYMNFLDKISLSLAKLPLSLNMKNEKDLIKKAINVLSKKLVELKKLINLNYKNVKAKINPLNIPKKKSSVTIYK